MMWGQIVSEMRLGELPEWKDTIMLLLTTYGMTHVTSKQNIIVGKTRVSLASYLIVGENGKLATGKSDLLTLLVTTLDLSSCLLLYSLKNILVYHMGFCLQQYHLFEVKLTVLLCKFFFCKVVMEAIHSLMY